MEIKNQDSRREIARLKDEKGDGFRAEFERGSIPIEVKLHTTELRVYFGAPPLDSAERKKFNLSIAEAFVLNRGEPTAKVTVSDQDFTPSEIEEIAQRFREATH